MENIYDKYEAVIGLEVHTQLFTRTKNFSSDPNEFGAIPNTNTSVISLGHPGTLPKLNKKTVEYAVRIGLACHCDITREMHFARKNYFYPDLPKGYQITQDTTPICRNGYVMIKDDNNQDKKIQLTRIHIEEDAGKSIHDVDPFSTLVDLNRAGVPLLEIVSEPELRTAKEAYNYLTEVRKLVRYLEICDGNMEEGSMRCDANISVRLRGVEKFGVKVEVKNMNSIRNVHRAIEFEIKRQIDAIEKNEIIYQETRNFDAVNGVTNSMRSKEMAHDYRYFPEPDLQPLFVSQEYIDGIKKTLPPLPLELFARYTKELGLTEYDAYQLTESKAVAIYFEELIRHTSNHKAAANWIMGSVRSWLNENGKEIDEFPLKPSAIAELIAMIDSALISNSAASQVIFPEMVLQPSKTARTIAEEKNLLQESDAGALKEFVTQAILNIGMEKVVEYKKGKNTLVGLFMGEVMKLSKGKADPKVARQLLVQALEETEVHL
jgi:aspartyl-tRNA(Asn)/glutamyl-tRNA(Gln) amidotransferase subunit B